MKPKRKFKMVRWMAVIDGKVLPTSSCLTKADAMASYGHWKEGVRKVTLTWEGKLTIFGAIKFFSD